VATHKQAMIGVMAARACMDVFEVQSGIAHRMRTCMCFILLQESPLPMHLHRAVVV
jgi:hypothetical protein